MTPSRSRFPRLLGFAAGLLASLSVHADATVKLYCAARVGGFYDAEMQLRERGANVVNVTFAHTLPSKVAIDWALRDCLNTALKLNATRDIVGLAWFGNAVVMRKNVPAQ